MRIWLSASVASGSLRPASARDQLPRVILVNIARQHYGFMCGQPIWPCLVHCVRHAPCEVVISMLLARVRLEACFLVPVRGPVRLGDVTSQPAG
jgi:hypothetical protein